MKPYLQKKFLFLTLVFSCAIKSFAQVPDTTTTEGLLHYILQPLDKGQVSTGFLQEWGAPMLPPATFNGTLTDSNRIDMNLWRTLYFQMQTSWCPTGINPLPAITSVNNLIKQNVGSGLPVPVPLLISQYNNVKSYAFTNKLLSYNSSVNQVNDVQGRSENPYQTNNLFAACPNKIVTIKGTESFVCKSDLIWNTTGKTISQIQIDFNNTLGFQNINIGTPITVTYADTGSKRWTIKVTLSDNSILRCYSDYYVAKAVAGNGAARYSAGTRFTPGWDTHWSIAPTANHSGADVYIAYTSHNRTNTLRKPLIVAEGYDVSHVAPDIQENYTYKDFVDGINEPRNT